PDRIRISGLEQRLRAVDAIPTRPIALQPGDSVFSRVVELDTTGLAGIQLSATRVRISGHVDRVLDRTFPDYPVSVGPGVTISPAEVTVRVRGPQSRLLELGAEDFRVVVAIDSIPSRVPAEGIL